MHPCSRWGKQPYLAHLVFLSVRDALYYHPHPDSKRQAKRRQRDLIRHGARILKQAHVTSYPVEKMDRRVEIRDIRKRLDNERLLIEHHTRELAKRLIGKGKSWAEMGGVTRGH